MSPAVLTTDRLILRAPEARDRDAFVGFCMDERSKWFGGPLTSSDARDAFDTWMSMADAASQGECYLSIALRDTGETIGRAGIRSGDDRPEAEIAYALYSSDHEGQGFASEAAVALREWGFGALGLDTLVSYIAPDNHRSAALVLRIGATQDPTATPWPKYDDLNVFRHPKGSFL
ncbi:Protein N-acetyltransferase, RimJ/RimL family [Aliiroseovarius halocynthiae]|uniref:GNAT family N-acetyltransferase n=1 Tax=Aliiroseovarius halocynthiae TaxID=985055 RepID=A0A545SUE5_9RHOB|nr:GNAT family N-acetyltransferase [Aliiroseovarius halocynthiae]TQV68564.1 GNAT family N-acetyltransferase [Aliiroseovarius halocynthiae]SMR70970.1 Protein N-acetyltransferase, RimJ/RimL family [Aliiroseovarius halocynthiae]